MIKKSPPSEKTPAMADKFEVVLEKKFNKTLEKYLSEKEQSVVLEKLSLLKINPFPEKKLKKRIHGVKYPLYRMRIDLPSDSYRIFYGIDGQTVYLLELVPKKLADRIIKNYR